MWDDERNPDQSDSDIQMKTIEHWLLFWRCWYYYAVQGGSTTFECMDKLLTFDHSNESQIEQCTFCGAICYAVYKVVLLFVSMHRILKLT